MDENLIEVKILTDIKVIKETLSRMGVGNLKKKILYPSCYLWENCGKQYIVHFKQLFQLIRETAYNNLSLDDIERVKAIIFNLKNWGLVEVDDSLIQPHRKFIFVLPHNQKNEWQIIHKFNFKTINTTKESPNG